MDILRASILLRLITWKKMENYEKIYAIIYTVQSCWRIYVNIIIYIVLILELDVFLPIMKTTLWETWNQDSKKIPVRIFLVLLIPR